MKHTGFSFFDQLFNIWTTNWQVISNNQCKPGESLPGIGTRKWRSNMSGHLSETANLRLVPGNQVWRTGADIVLRSCLINQSLLKGKKLMPVIIRIHDTQSAAMGNLSKSRYLLTR